MKNTKLFWLLLALVLASLLAPGSASAQERVDLFITLSGNYYNKLNAGEDNTLYLELRNTGTTTLTNLRLSAEGPAGWSITFQPASIGSLTPGSVQTVDFIVWPDPRAGRSDYQINIIAEANELRKVNTIWVVVSAASFWLWVGIGLVAVLVAAFAFIFWRYGRK